MAKKSYLIFITLITILCLHTVSVAAYLPVSNFSQLAEDIELALTPESDKYQVQLKYAYNHLIKAKDLWIADQDDNAKEELSHALDDLILSWGSLKDSVANSPQVTDIKEIAAKIGREANDAVNSLQESIADWLQ